MKSLSFIYIGYLAVMAAASPPAYAGERESLFQKYGNGKAGAVSIQRILKSSTTVRTKKEDALKSLPFYGIDAAPVYLDFIEQTRADATWLKPVADGVSHLLDRRLLPWLITAARTTKDPVVLKTIIPALGAYISQSIIWIEVHGRTPGEIRHVALGGSVLLSSDEIVSKGVTLTLNDRAPIKKLLDDLLNSNTITFDVREEALATLSRIKQQEKDEKSRLEAAPPVPE
ncbi:MAG TPA: hypothetical protein VGM51_00945 [Armatimonadota bacterium]|jgi:hypothetical protein